MFWISYYLDKGHRLDYLLNLPWEDQEMLKQSMEKMNEERALYDVEKMKVFLKALGGGKSSE